MSRRREPVKDEQLEAAVQKAIAAKIPLSAVCLAARVDQSTLWKWRNSKSSPTMAARQAVLEAIDRLVRGAS